MIPVYAMTRINLQTRTEMNPNQSCNVRSSVLSVAFIPVGYGGYIVYRGGRTFKPSAKWDGNYDGEWRKYELVFHPEKMQMRRTDWRKFHCEKRATLFRGTAILTRYGRKNKFETIINECVKPTTVDIARAIW